MIFIQEQPEPPQFEEKVGYLGGLFWRKCQARQPSSGILDHTGEGF